MELLELERNRNEKRKKFSRPCTHLSHIMSQLVGSASTEISLKQSALESRFMSIRLSAQLSPALGGQKAKE